MSVSETIAARPAPPMPSRRPIDGPSAWVGADLRKREAEWSYRLAPAEIAEIEAALRRERRVHGNALPSFLDLLLHHSFVHSHDEDVVEVELQTGVEEHANDIRQVIELVLREKLFAQVE